MLVQVLHLGQAALAGYGAQQSYIAITNLQKYEDASKKLAKYSNEAERQLYKTRTTQASGAVSVLVSLFVSLFLVFRGSSSSFIVRYLSSPAMAGAILLARTHMQQYWTGKDGKTVGMRIPLPKMDGYNDAQKKTEELLKVLEWLMLSWIATTFVAVFD